MSRKHTYTDIRLRKRDLDKRRADHFKRLHEKTLERFSLIQVLQVIRQTSIEHKKILHQLKMEKHLEVRNDLQRKQLISLKKLFQFKKDRLKKNLKYLQVTRVQKANMDQYASWNKRLAERIAYQQRIQQLLLDSAERKKFFIQNHRNKYLVKWAKLQEDIKNRAAYNRAHSYFGRLEKRKERAFVKKAAQQKTGGKQLRGELEGTTTGKIVGSGKQNTIKGTGNDVGIIEKKSNLSICEDFQSSFDNLLDEEVCMALHAALELEDNRKLPFESDDPIYKAAKFIMDHILVKFDKDLSGDKELFKTIYNRMDSFFDEAKKFVLFVSNN